MKRDWLDLVPRPVSLVRRLRALAVGGALTTLGVADATAISLRQASAARTEPSVGASIVNRSRKAAKLVLQLPAHVGTLLAQHRSHRSHSSHRSHASHYSGSGGVVSPPRTTAPAAPPPAASPRRLTTGSEFTPVGERVELFDWLGGKPRVITAQEIAKERLRFVVLGVDAHGGRNYLKVSVRSNGIERNVGWVLAPAATGSAPTPAPAAAETAPAGQIAGRFASFDRAGRTLTVTDAVGATFEFVLRDDTQLLLTSGTRRLDEYLEANFNNHPWSTGQHVQVTWKPSVDGKRRVAVSVR